VLYNRLLLLVAGLGGLPYGVDKAITSSARPCLQPTFTLPETEDKTLEEIEEHFEGRCR
jgi:hypothetical protein